ncbi:MAG: hypothetical protein L0210_13865 [Rhodospirillales bacterium]|nr:hypothetical protein [Rhodospirillales bacterium]
MATVRLFGSTLDLRSLGALALALLTTWSPRGSRKDTPPRTKAAADPNMAQITVSATAPMKNLMAAPYCAGGGAGSAEAAGSAELLLSFRTGKSGAVTLNPQAATIRLETRKSAVVMPTTAAQTVRAFRCMERLLILRRSFAWRLQRKVLRARQNHRTQ